jgi:hypothetical protein
MVIRWHKGRRSRLTVAAVGSFIAGTIAIIGMQLFSPHVNRPRLWPPEYFALMVFSFRYFSKHQFTCKGSLMFALGALSAYRHLPSTVSFVSPSAHIPDAEDRLSAGSCWRLRHQ